MPELPVGLTRRSLSSDSEYDHALHGLSLQVNAIAEDWKNDNKTSHDSTNSQHNFTEVSMNSRSVEPTGDTDNRCATSRVHSGALGGLIGEAWTVACKRIWGVSEKKSKRRCIRILGTLESLTLQRIILLTLS